MVLPMVGRTIALAVSSFVAAAAMALSGWAPVVQRLPVQATGGGNPSCEAAIDLMLVVDGSGSIFAHDFRTMQGFSQDLAGSFVISPEGAHVGVAQFSGEGQGRLEAGLSSDAAAVKSAIDSMAQIEGFTDIQEGIQLGQAEMAAHSRAGVPHIMVVLTDGQQEGAPGDPVAEAQSARNAGTEIFAIGVGGGPNLDQLNAIASDPDAGHVFSVEDFDGLASVLNQLVANTCPPSTPTTPLPSQTPATTPTATVGNPEPKDDPSSCTDIFFDVRISNVAISPAGDWDYYCFTATAGQNIAADVDAEVDGSALDPVLTLMAPDGTSVLAQNDDWDDLDPYLEHSLPASGRYFLRVESFDHPCCGGPDHTYSLLLTKLSAAPTATATRTLAPMATPTPRRLMGDANCDGQVDSVDASLVLQYDAGLSHSLPCPDLADVNQDGQINSLDASLILQYNAGLLYRLPP
jgi:hypothetical protein